MAPRVKSKKKLNEKDALFEVQSNIDLYNPPEPKLLEVQISDSMLSYGSYIIEERSIPSAMDGLKPSQRRAIYTFKHINKIGQNVKLSKISGNCIAEFHPHGDSSINDAIANMLQPWKNNFPLFVGQGNWGSIAGDNPAAARYVEVKLNKFVDDLLFENINKGVVPWEYNYDDTTLEPTLLPVKFPIHLINGTSGIAYSMSTSIPSFNIKELANMMIYMIENKYWDNSIWHLEDHKENLLGIVKGPDLPTGASIYMKSPKEDYLFSSSYAFGMRAEYEINEKDMSIVFSNIPINVTSEKIKDEITDLALDYKIEMKSGKEIKVPKEPNEILNLKASSPIIFEIEKNNSAKCFITVFFKSGANLNTELVKILTKTSLDTSFNAYQLMINDRGLPEALSVYQNIRLFLYFRRHIVYQSILHDVEKLKSQIHLLEGLNIVLNSRDKFFEIVSKSINVEDDLRSYFTMLTEKQLVYILDIKLSKVTQNSAEDLPVEINDKLEILNSKLKDIESSDTIFDLIKNDYLNLLEKNKDVANANRRSNILDSVAKLSFEDTIDDQSVIVMLMNDETIGYIEKNKFEARNRGSKLKNSKINQSGFDINVKTIYDGNIKDECFFITNKGRIFKEVLWSFSKKFGNVRNYFNLMSDEDIIKIIKFDELENEQQNLILISNLMVKNIKLSLFDNVSSKSGKYAISLQDGDVLTNVLIHNPMEKEVLVVLSTDGKVLKFDKEQVRETKSGKSIGTRIMNKKCSVLDAFLINIEEQDKYDLLLISSAGRGKKVALSEIAQKEIKQTPIILFSNDIKNGNLIKGLILETDQTNEVVLISESGDLSIIKIDEDLRNVSRQAKGSIMLIKNDNNEKIVFATKNTVIENEGFSEEDLELTDDTNENDNQTKDSNI